MFRPIDGNENHSRMGRSLWEFGLTICEWFANGLQIVNPHMQIPVCLANSRMISDLCMYVSEHIQIYCFLLINDFLFLLAPTAPFNCDIKKRNSTSILVSWNTPYPFDYKVEFYKVKVQYTFNILRNICMVN